MPVFTEGQDPLGPQTDIRLPLARPEPAPDYSVRSAMDAAMDQFNPVVNVVRALTRHFDFDPDHNPIEAIKGTAFENQPDEFVGSRNAAETQSIMTRLEERRRNEQTISEAGPGGVVATLAAGMLDPTIFLPLSGAVRAARGVWSTTRSAVNVGLMSGLQAGVSQAALTLTQPGSDPSEIPMAVGTGTLLGAFLGAGSAAMLNRSERRALEKLLDVDRAAMGEGAGLPVNRSIGAAEADTRSLEPVSVVPEALRNLVPPSWRDKAADWLMRFSPTQRTFFAHSSVEARRAMAELIEIPFELADSAAGVTATRDGLPPVGRLVWQYQRKMTADASHKLEDEFLAYRYGAEGGSMNRASLEDVSGRQGEKMTFGQFKGEVAKALRNGDVSDIPQVAAVAQHMRSTIFDPLEERLVDAEMLSREDIAPKGDKSFFSRVWNKERIAADRPRLRQVVTDWLDSEQGAKAASKDRISQAAGARKEIDGQLGRLEARLERLARRQEATGIRQDEQVRGLNV